MGLLVLIASMHRLKACIVESVANLTAPDIIQWCVQSVQTDLRHQPRDAGGGKEGHFQLPD